MMWHNCLVGVSLLLLAASPVRAQDGGVQRPRDACRDDYRTLCSGVQPGGGRIMACFRQHADQLSGGCIDALKAARQMRNQGG